MADSRNVFINCPFDGKYKPLFYATVFAVFDCGYRARCALEVDDSGDTRITKINQIIVDCPFGIHDISRTQLDYRSRLPRFNMPFELGLFLGAKFFGGRAVSRKRCIVMDRDRYRYQQFISDIAGQDIRAHNNDPRRAIAVIRDWLRATSGDASIPGATEINRRYERFQNDLPRMCRRLPIKLREMTFVDYRDFVSAWLDEEQNMRKK